MLGLLVLVFLENVAERFCDRFPRHNRLQLSKLGWVVGLDSFVFDFLGLWEKLEIISSQIYVKISTGEPGGVCRGSDNC